MAVITHTEEELEQITDSILQAAFDQLETFNLTDMEESIVLESLLQRIIHYGFSVSRLARYDA